MKAIHGLSRKFNRLKKKPHGDALLELMRKHVKEISSLYRNKDKHYLVETGDLIILCFEMLLEKRIAPDPLMAVCYRRYRRKLTQLLKDI